MENASKALLIAGAILIVIVLISIGMLIVNSTNDVTEQATTTAQGQAIQTFNSQFTQYEGTQKGSTVKNLYQSVQASNAANRDSGERQVQWNGHAPDPATDKMSEIKNSAKYTVDLTYGSDGYVSGITVAPKQP